MKRKKHHFQVRIEFEPNRHANDYLTITYERIIPAKPHSQQQEEEQPEASSTGDAKRKDASK